jgi:hypothetical protein
MSVIWRIVRKDWGQLWPLVVIVAIAQWTNATLWFSLGHFSEPHGLVIFAELFSFLIVLGMAALITATVHQDVLPGVSQDWLVRPIRRGDLLRAKLLFVVVAVHGPMFLADFAHAATTGFTLRGALAAALSRSAFMLLVFDLPVLAIAAITSTIVQVAVALLGIWFVVVTGVFAGILMRGGAPPPFASSGIQWMMPTFWSLLAIVAAAVIVPLQYFRRATTRARRIVGCAVLLAPMLSCSTWNSAFSLQRWLSPDPIAAESIVIAFDPGLGKSAAVAASASPDALLLPIRVSGLKPESIVMKDRADIRLVGPDGTTLFRGRTTVTLGYGVDFSVRTAEGGEARTYQRIMLPGAVYERVRTQRIRVEIDYSLTLFQLEAANAMAAIQGDGRFAAFGWCRTKIDEDGDEVELGCVNTGRAPTCVSLTLENPTHGKRNPADVYCDPDYTPYPVHVYPDAMSQLAYAIRFRDVHGLAKYPVDGSQLADARVLLKSYRPHAHFTRRLVIPEIRLSEWTANAAHDETRAH